jgi:hypothetical protein
VISGLAYLAIAVSLAVAVWAFVECARTRAPGQALYTALTVVWVLVTAESVVATVRLIGGSGPSSSNETITFIGYLLTTVLLPIAGIILARMEPTRWGSALIGAAAVVVPVLVLRMVQVWNA